MSGLKDFAKRIREKLTEPAEGDERKEPPEEVSPAGDDRLKLFIKMIRSSMEKEGLLDGETSARGELATLILPKVLGTTDKMLKGVEAKDWAFACGQFVGLLAGLGVAEARMDAAIEEVMESAKEYAHIVNDVMKKAGMVEEHPTPETVKPDSSSKSMQLSMIEDLEAQAAKETDPSAAAAMRAMAAKIKREVRDGTKLNIA